MAHAITLSSDLGDKLLFASMRADEQLGRLFRYDIEVLSQDDKVDLRGLLGTSMTVKLATTDGYTRHFNGIVVEAAQTGFRTVDKLSYAIYQVALVPKPWLLTRKVDCRIYVDQSVPDIVRAVLGEIGYGDLKLSLSGNYDTREYCVQYREDYFNFISRLLEQEGIYYFFTHSASTHTMVLADALGAHARTPSFEKIRMRRLCSKASAMRRPSRHGNRCAACTLPRCSSRTTTRSIRRPRCWLPRRSGMPTTVTRSRA